MTESEDKEDCKTVSEESEEEQQMKSEDEEQEVKKSLQKANGNRKPQINSEDSSDEEMNESEKEGDESNCGDSPKETVKKKASTTMNGETGSSNNNQGNKTPQSDEEKETDSDSKSEKSDKINGSDSSDNIEKGDYANLHILYINVYSFHMFFCSRPLPFKKSFEQADCLQLSQEPLIQTTSHLTLCFLGSSAIVPPSVKLIGWTVAETIEDGRRKTPSILVGSLNVCFVIYRRKGLN